MKKKIRLYDIEIKSFVTTIENREQETIVGGSGWAVCSLYLSGCATTLTVPAKPPLKDKTPARVVSAVQGNICNHLIEESRRWKELGMECPYTAVNPNTVGGA